MKIPADIHTHRLAQIPGEAIVNCYPENFAPLEGEWYSVGVHPWHIGKTDGTSSVKHLEEIVLNPQVLAIGEAGLDKLANAPLSLQTAVFGHQARLAMKVGKPLIIHLVKATDELLQLKQTLHPDNPWIIHGFRGKTTLADTYLKHGFHLSFGEKYQEETLRMTPADRLFIETDESTIPVEELYARAARVRGVSPGELLETVQRNIRQVFFKL